MDEWNKICNWLLYSDECKDVHKIVSPSGGFANFTDANGEVYQIRKGITPKEAVWVIDKIKEINRNKF